MKIFRSNIIANLIMLFVSKAGGVLVTLIFTPLYYKLLGPEQFSIVAVILSLQSLLLMLDLGMTTMVSREVAIYGTRSLASVKIWANAEAILTFFYLCLFLLAIIFGFYSVPKGLVWYANGLIITLFWLMVMQNLSQTVLLGGRLFKISGTIQLVGTLLRASLTVIALKFYSSSVECFLTSQLFGTLFQFIVTRNICKHFFSTTLISKIKYSFGECKALFKNGTPLLFLSLSGAAVSQLDKPIIASFLTAKVVSTYFLAVTFCLTPISVLGGPIYQYFLPNLTSMLAEKDSGQLTRHVSLFVIVLVFSTVIPTVSLLFYSEYWIRLWLGNVETTIQVSEFVSILLPGVLIGAMGYIPFSMLTACQDYQFQARLALFLTSITLALVVFFAQRKSIDAICFVYAGYHIVSTSSSWIRAIQTDKTRIYAKYALILTTKFVIGIFFVAKLIKLILVKFCDVQYGMWVFILILGLIGLIFFLFEIRNIKKQEYLLQIFN
ncbi:lipopolysaccharide biosynthesis protein [Undibacterium sp. RuRC25W]|uniref:lipopolysaccharide biosynthesis protein n=1 Tax=Undibacterium sp. RuRC25W TaxID=3413047 RepID=UPI003BF11063